MNKFKDLYKLQKQAKEIQKQLMNTHVEADENGVKVTVNGKMELVSVEISDEAYENKRKMEKSLVIAFNKAVNRAQQIGAEQMKDVMGDMGLGGLPGM